MAIEKKLIHFNKKEVFDQKLAEKEILDTSIVFIKDSNMIHTHGEDYRFIGWTVLSNSNVPPDGYDIITDSEHNQLSDSEGLELYIKTY